MNIIINTVMVICFLFSLYMLIAKISGGSIIMKMIFKTLSLVGTLFPIIYLMKQLNLI